MHKDSLSPLGTRTSAAGQAPATTTNPIWWTEQHRSAWDRVKEAFRRDWEQTKNDVSTGNGHDLNQGVGDTLKQAFGSEGLPPAGVPTHVSSPKEVEKNVSEARSKVVKAESKADEQLAKARVEIAQESSKLDEKVLEARTELANDRAKGDKKIGELQAKSEARIAAGKSSVAEEHERLGKKVSEVRDGLAEDEEDAREKLSKARTATAKDIGAEQERMLEVARERDETVAKWRAVERDAQYGYSVRSQYGATTVWDDELEGKLHSEWEGFSTGRTWDDSKQVVHRGWDFAAKRDQ